MSAKYIIRLDDASEFMNYEKWLPFFALFKKYNIYPIIAVIPYNKDPKLINDTPDVTFWETVRQWKEKEYVVALHGYQHLYFNKESGIMGINNYSEFANIPFEKQLEMIKSGLKKFRLEGIYTNMFVAPAHSFDYNTIKALKTLNIQYISDGFFIKPINKNGINWIPQQLWEPIKKKKGVWTICIHPETSDNKYISMLDRFLKDESSNFIHPYRIPIDKNLQMTEVLENLIMFYRFKIKRSLKRIVKKLKTK